MAAAGILRDPKQTGSFAAATCFWGGGWWGKNELYTVVQLEALMSKWPSNEEGTTNLGNNNQEFTDDFIVCSPESLNSSPLMFKLPADAKREAQEHVEHTAHSCVV